MPPEVVSPLNTCRAMASSPTIETERSDRAMLGKAERRLVHLPFGRFAQASEIANGALFLASDESSFITASGFLVDGGISGAYVTPL